MSLLQIQRKTRSEKEQKPNLTGIPSYMKQDFEARSGLSYDDVRIHYSSPKPAEVGALAYTQGPHVYIGPGQERHLPHELVHVAQQKRGEVRPTGSLGMIPLNDDPELERQADKGIVAQRAQAPSSPASQIVQRKIGMEYQTVGGRNNVFTPTVISVKANTEHRIPLFESEGIKVTADGPDLEYVTPAVDTPKQALEVGRKAAEIHQQLRTYDGNGLTIGGLRSMEPEDVAKERNIDVYTGYLTVNHDVEKRSWECRTGDDVYMLMNIGVTAHPQATVGIRMNKIAYLLLDLGGIKAGAEDKDLTGRVPLGITTARLVETRSRVQAGIERMELLAKQKKTMRDAPHKAMAAIIDYMSQHPEAEFTDWDSIWGLISLLFAHHDQFLLIMDHPLAATIAKDAMPVMNRTSLYDAYCALDENDQDIFLNIMKNELHMMRKKRVDDTSNRWTKKRLGAEGAARIEIPLAGMFLGPESWDTVSLKQWVKGLDDGWDAMYRRFYSIGSIADQDKEDPNADFAKFNLQRSTDIGLGEEVPGLLVELRGLERGVPFGRWGEIAERVARLVNDLNGVKETD